MSKYELPDLPSDKELGLTAEEIKELEAEFGDTGPEMSPEEMAALLGEEPPAPVNSPTKYTSPLGAVLHFHAFPAIKPPDISSHVSDSLLYRAA